MTKISFIERLKLPAAIVTDGSIATELLLRNCNELPADIYNLKNPVVIEAIHRDFMNVGAEIIQTNTISANRIALERLNLADKVYEINRKGVWIARCVALHQAYVAGVVGPVGKFLEPVGKIKPADVRQAFIEQIVALVDGGIDILMLKSFIDIAELEIAIEAAQFVSPNIPIIAQKTFPEDGDILATDFPSRIARRLIEKGVAGIGANATVGPQRMLGIIQSLMLDETIVCSQPDVGIPTLVDGRAMYNAEPMHVAKTIREIVEAGAKIIGADGGASVEHIRAIAESVRGINVGGKKIASKKIKIIANNELEKSEGTQFSRNIGKKFLATVELDVPRGMDISSIIVGAEYLKKNGLDAVNITDGARARLRMNSIVISHLVQQQTGMECITHIACRDRNMVGLQSELLGASALSVKNFLAITGDPAQIGDYPYATSVYDIDAIGLIRAMSQMNQGKDLMQNPLGNRTEFCITCACNPLADDLEREIARLERKAAEGARLVFSQPVFEMATLDIFLEKIKHIDIQFMLGIIPLRSIRHAEFLHYEVPGMFIPDWVRSRMQKSSHSAEASLEEGISMAVEFLREAKDKVAGVYMMPPFKKYSVAVEILQRL